MCVRRLDRGPACWPAKRVAAYVDYVYTGGVDAQALRVCVACLTCTQSSDCSANFERCKN